MTCGRMLLGVGARSMRPSNAEALLSSKYDVMNTVSVAVCQVLQLDLFTCIEGIYHCVLSLRSPEEDGEDLVVLACNNC